MNRLSPYAILCLAVRKFWRINGAQWAAAFGFNAFFALFPLMVLFVTVASSFVDRDRAGKEIILHMESSVPISGDMQRHIFDTIAGVIQAREQAGVIALFILLWVALQCFVTLIYATNHAWGGEVHAWWRLPLKSLVLLGITAGAVLVGMAVPVLAKMAEDWLFPANALRPWIYALWGSFIPLLLVFLSLSLFYRLAPGRAMQFSGVWTAALCATALLYVAQTLFVIYLKNFATFNAVYGAFGGIMALLLWIYLCGCILIFGACLCAAQAEGRSAQAETQ